MPAKLLLKFCVPTRWMSREGELLRGPLPSCVEVGSAGISSSDGNISHSDDADGCVEHLQLTEGFDKVDEDLLRSSNILPLGPRHL
jgi:hypothetical protein